MFIETSFEGDSAKGSHLVIDAVAVPDGSLDEEDEIEDFDLELVF